MWNLMVAEDEAIVRLGLKTMIDWQRIGIEWAVEASDGEEAWQRFCEHGNIHLVVTDIRMPHMDGIELARRIKERSPFVPVVFLTSYDDFAYVKEALRLGAADYLHKPTMGEQELSETLHKAVAFVAAHFRQQEAASPEAAVATATDEARGEFLLSMLDSFTLPTDWRERWTSLNLPAIVGRYVLISFRIIPLPGGEPQELQLEHSRFSSIRHFIEAYLSHDKKEIVFARGTREIIWINGGHGEHDESMETVLPYTNRLVKKVKDVLQIELSYTCSRVHELPDELPEAYLESLVHVPADDNQLTPIVRIIKSYLDEHFCEEISLAKLAEQANASISYVSRQFVKEIGENFNEYLTRKRIQRAKKLLRETNLKLYEIATLVGYKNPHYFSNLFKSLVGVTPVEFRNAKT
ncbi:MAG: response regulator [Paenibacillaceae bacterium]|nr:response regulator [Paenibacillaceae bacterium]